MTTPGTPVDVTPPASAVVSAAAPLALAPPSRRWLLAALAIGSERLWRERS
jgi:hypothetical protein